MRLSDLKSKQEFLNITQATTAKSSTPDALSAVWSTLSLLDRSSCTPNHLGFSPPSLTLMVSSSTHKLHSIPSAEASFIESLTRAAHVTAASLACSSVLAGLSSESDEFGDVGILLPVLGGDRETEIVKLLGLEDWLQNGGKIVKYQESSSDLPSGLTQMPQMQRTIAENQLDEFMPLLSRLDQTFEFRLESGKGSEGTVVWFLLGKMTSNKEPVWGGLIGAGTWADF